MGETPKVTFSSLSSDFEFFGVWEVSQDFLKITVLEIVKCMIRTEFSNLTQMCLSLAVRSMSI